MNTFSNDALTFANKFPFREKDVLLAVENLFLRVSIFAEFFSLNFSLVTLLSLHGIFLEARRFSVVVLGIVFLQLLLRIVLDLLGSFAPEIIGKVFGVGTAPLSAFVNYKNLFLIRRK